MSTVVCIEFDQQGFRTTLDCELWLRSSDYATLTHLKDFKLKTINNSTFISPENRRVWQWKNDAWKYGRLAVDRPAPFIYVVLADSEPRYTLQDCPPLSQKFAARIQEKLIKQEERDKRFHARKEKIAKDRQKRQESKKKQKKTSQATVDPNPLDEQEAKLARQEERKKRKRSEKRDKNDKHKSKKTKKEKTKAKKQGRKKIKKEEMMSDDETEEQSENSDQEELASQVKTAMPVPKMNGAILATVPVPEAAKESS